MPSVLRLKYLSSAAVMVSVLTTTPVMAQDLIDGDIIVTARRFEERLQDVPISMTVFNQDQLTDRNVFSAGDLAAYTPSLTSNSRFGAENASFAIRGFTQENATSPSVGVYFADVVAPRANAGTVGGNGAGPGAFFDLQNVQVLKGPQGTLFGRNTTGGAVLLVPQKPTHNTEGYVEGSIGNYDMRRIQGVVNVPLADTFRLRLGVDHQKRDGYLKNMTSVGPRDFGDVNYTAFRVSLVADLTPNLENYLVANYTQSDVNGGLSRMVATAPYTGTKPVRHDGFLKQIALTSGGFYQVANNVENPFIKSNQWQVINTTTWQASDTITIKNIVSYAEFKQRQSNNIYGDAGFGPNDQNWPNPSYYSPTMFTPEGSYTFSQSTFTEELQLQGTAFKNRLNYQIGGYIEISNPLNGMQETYTPNRLLCMDPLALDCTTAPGLAGGAISLSRNQYRFRNYGIYGQGTYDLTDTLALTAGIRYTWDRTSGIGEPLRVAFDANGNSTLNCAIQPEGSTPTSAEIQNDISVCTFRAKADSQKPTWVLGLDFKPWNDGLLYAKYARGYRQGSVNVATHGWNSWKPETVDTYEIGAKIGFNGFIRGNFNIAAFYNDFRDQQLQMGGNACSGADMIANPVQCPFSASPGVGIVNVGTSMIKGIEIDTTLHLFEGFRLDLAYAYLDSKLKSADLDNVPIPVGFITRNTISVGSVLPLTPKNKFSVSANYTLPLSESIGRISFGGTFTYQSKSRGVTNSLPEYQYLPVQKLLNLNATWKDVGGTPIDLGLFATNVTKEKFHVFTSGRSFGYEAVSPNQPRMYGARVRFNFGG